MLVILRFCDGGKGAVRAADDDQPGLFLERFLQTLRGFAFGQKADYLHTQNCAGIWRGRHRHLFPSQIFIKGEQGLQRNCREVEGSVGLFLRRRMGK